VHPFIFGDFFSQGFCGSLHLLGIHGRAGQFRKQLTAFLEADHGPYGAYHTCEGWRERGPFYAQMLIARTEAVAAARAVIVGTLELQGTEYAVHLLVPTPDQPRGLPTTTTSLRASLIAGVGVETLL
jgi:hypothetical protein